MFLPSKTCFLHASLRFPNVNLLGVLRSKTIGKLKKRHSSHIQQTADLQLDPGMSTLCQHSLHGMGHTGVVLFVCLFFNLFLQSLADAIVMSIKREKINIVTDKKSTQNRNYDT